MKLCPLVIAVFLLFFINFGTAATIQGTIYDAVTLETLPNTIIDVNSIPAQQFVSKDGTYSFELLQGNYSIHAVFFEEDFKLVADENIEIESEGDFVLDLILFPDFESPEKTDDFPVGTGQTGEPKQNNETFFGFNLFQWLLVAILGIFLAVIALQLFFGFKKISKKEIVKNPNGEKHKKSDSSENLDKYALEVLDVLRRSGNRLTQKELREKIDSVGEAKISLIISELEHSGKIKKIKKGRGNIIVLKA